MFGCLNCGVDWGGQKAAGANMTTSNTPAFYAAGAGTISLTSNNGGGAGDLVTLRINQVNRDAMVNVTMYQSVDDGDPTPATSSDVTSRRFIANADLVPVVPVFHYGSDSTGADRQYPAGPGMKWSAIWDGGAATVTPDETFAPRGVNGHSILAVPVPKLTTGNHSFVIKATLPSGKTYTTPSMTVFV